MLSLRFDSFMVCKGVLSVLKWRLVLLGRSEEAKTDKSNGLVDGKGLHAIRICSLVPSHDSEFLGSLGSCILACH